MSDVRLSTPQDIPALRELWCLAFGDSGAYVDNFFQRYYRPERVLVLEDEGQVRSMTAWFDTTFVVPDQGEFKAAYLYAVATHPDCRGKGLAARLLAGADDWFRSQNIPAVTTVPAQPSLHTFFGANGFRECFTLVERALTPDQLPESGVSAFRPLTPAEYGSLRESLLDGTPHIAYPVDALAYQEGCCLLSGGGLYEVQTAYGPVCLCAEGASDGLIVLKECLGSFEARQLALSNLPRIASAQRWLVREPLDSISAPDNPWAFAMLKWLDPDQANSWDWSSTAYLGLAFD